MTLDLLRLTQIARRSLVDHAGDVLGRVDDLVVALGTDDYPAVSGVQARIGKRRVFVPIAQVAELSPGPPQLTGATLNLQRFERREGEVLLRQDILHHKVIHVESGRLLRVSDIALGYFDGAWRVVGIDIAPQSALRWALPGRPPRPLDASIIVDWMSIEPFVGHVPSSKLRLSLQRIRRLHPAQIADLVEAASHEEGSEIITAVRADPELEADVFEELDTEHQIEFLLSRPDVEAAAVLATMAPDDAADLIGDLPQERRASILIRLPMPQGAKVRGLLAYNPSTAGGLMTPDFLGVEANRTVEQVIEHVRESPMVVQSIYLADRENRLMGSASLHDLLRAQPGTCIQQIARPIAVRCRPDADFTDVALLMADYNLTELPIVDEGNRLVGVISVDDVLETLIPDEWRRREEGSVG